MKRLLIIPMLLSFVLGFSQNAFEGEVTYKISYDNLPPEMVAMEAMLPQEAQVFIKDKMSRTEQTTMGQSNIVISNMESGETITLMNLMGKKVAMKGTDDQSAEAEKARDAMEFEKRKGTKSIGGIKCYQGALVMEVEGETIEMIVWYTDKFKNSNLMLEGVPGLPLEYTIVVPGAMTMIMTAEKVDEKKIDDDLFEIPTDYEITTQEELMQMIGE